MGGFSKMNPSQFLISLRNPDGVPEIRSSSAVLAFLELAFYQLLYVKNVYPREIFRMIKRKDIPIWVCTDPDVQEYVLHFLNIVHGCLTKDREVIAIFFLKRVNGELLEQFNFDLKVQPCDLISEEQMVTIVDNLSIICEDIAQSNIFTEENGSRGGSEEVTFELQVRINLLNVFPPVTMRGLDCIQNRPPEELDEKTTVYEVVAVRVLLE
ncbi:hypothetical protein CEXT_172661 [Caerostris extrusa]|uniref:HORMA domain-containing protein n=1 Tax=Caerostris extrusa TaxID=172846 RepID=A0AAV4XGT3_CAEEX|nr:hypothetical protein CEXT_172661 [Caerostris extrusa]